MPTRPRTRSSYKIVAEFDKHADAAGLANVQSPLGLTPYQVLVSASLIQAESGSDADSPLISAVIVNRLRDKMLLQIDATLCYAKGGCPPVPVDADKKIDSPYNTYKVQGLPPTPIETVTATALAAAIEPCGRRLQVLRLRQERKDVLRDDPSGARTQRRESTECRLTMLGVTPSSCSTGSSHVRVEYACSLHRDQTRKGTDVPYAAHLLGVASLVLEGGGNQTGSDRGAAPRRARGHVHHAEADPKRFGRKVARIVVECTDVPVGIPEEAEAATPRRSATGSSARCVRSSTCEIPKTSASVLRVKASDALYNARATLADLRRFGPETWERFNAGAVDQLWFYRSLSIVLSARLPGLLSDELRVTVREMEQVSGWWFDVGDPQSGR